MVKGRSDVGIHEPLKIESLKLKDPRADDG